MEAEWHECSRSNEHQFVPIQRPVRQCRKLSIVRQQQHQHRIESGRTAHGYQQQQLLTFLSQPVGQTNYQGGKFQIGTVVLGSGPVKYQWYYGPGPSIYQPTYTPVAGATNDSLVFDPALASQTGYYYVTASNSVTHVLHCQLAGLCAGAVCKSVGLSRHRSAG